MSHTFVLVHGAWHGGWCWRRVAVGELDAGGFEGALDGGEVVLVRNATAFFEVYDNSPRNRCGNREISLRHFDQAPGASALRRR